MRGLIAAISLMMGILFGMTTLRGQDRESLKAEEARIRAIVEEGIVAWNEHDMVKFATHFTKDADFINIRGTWWKGRKEIESAHIEAHKRFFGQSTLRLIDCKIKMLRPDVAVVIMTAEMKGHNLPKDIYRTDNNRLTQVFVKDQGQWQIASLENVNIADALEKK